MCLIKGTVGSGPVRRVRIPGQMGPPLTVQGYSISLIVGGAAQVSAIGYVIRLAAGEVDPHSKQVLFAVGAGIVGFIGHRKVARLCVPRQYRRTTRVGGDCAPEVRTAPPHVVTIDNSARTVQNHEESIAGAAVIASRGYGEVG